MSVHRFTVELSLPDQLLEEERRLHARGTAPLPDHPAECDWTDLCTLAEIAEAKIEIVDYVQVGPPS